MWKWILMRAHQAGFTRNEAVVILFLAATLLSGATIQALQRTDTAVPEDIRTALERQDSTFAAHSAAPAESLAATVPPEHAMLPATAPTPSAGRTVAGAPVNINTANRRMLETLPGVGPSTAENILDHRGANGPFLRAEDLMKVKGIGPKKFEKIRQYITVE
ncbi:MAG: helix-hairpin-helix domain-containing protein [Bacteroidota bacterium]|jgi:comEA protein|nr:helix-hairpin-helix domain-containing protein [Bacteroidota bacterium]